VLGPPPSSARFEEHEQAFFRLLQSGEAQGLAVVATEPGQKLDRELRRSLLTVEIRNIPAQVVLGPVAVVGGEVPGAAGRMARWKVGIRSCYQEELAERGDLTGKVQLSFHVAADGKVASLKATPSGRLSSELVKCITSRVAGTLFERPTVGTPEIRVSVELKRGG